MVMIQIDLSSEEDKIISLYKIQNNLETKETAVKEIIKKSKKCEHKFEMISQDGTVIHRIVQRCVNCGTIKQDQIFPNGIIETTFSK